MTYTEKLSARIAATGSQLCVGLDPRPENFDGGLEAFVRGIVEQTAPYAAAFKPNAAYFEACGAEGVRVLESVLRAMPREIPVILDAKRSDIPETMRYYAKAYFEGWNVDAVTLNGFMGFDSIEPFLAYEGKGVYLLGVTSNPGAADIELQKVGERYVFELIQDFSRRAAELPGDVGLVVGLTNVSDEVLSRVADIPLLVPGLGAQGGDLSRLDLRSRQAPVLVNASRSILYGKEGTPAQRAEQARDTIRAART
jgi:orotidine-5'-phosphate decarboxylase